jgi:sugar phosphate isomerase/epimerase
MSGMISIREGGYGSWENAVANIADAGIRNVEINVRPLDQLETIAAACKEAGVSILTLSGGVNLDQEASIDAAVSTLDACAKLGVPIWFCSANGTELDRAIHMARLRYLGDEATARGVVISLETHPPFCQNADGMLQTIEEVGSPAVRINLDTANIFYYNEGLDSADELERVIGVTASLHLKDTDGGYHSPNFPVLGEGVVQFPRIKQILASANFTGPLTLELEGPLVDGLGVQQRHEKVVACMDYLRSVGLA